MRRGPRRTPPAFRGLLALALFTSGGCGGFEDPVFDDMGPAAHCAAFDTWERAWSEAEVDMAQAISSARGAGGDCGEQSFGANAPLVTMVPELRCAARQHASDLRRRGTLDHYGKDGRSPVDRIYAAEYPGIPRGQLIARGDLDTQAVLSAWLSDPEQCAALLDRELDEVGVGVRVKAAGDVPYWVVTLGTRR